MDPLPNEILLQIFEMCFRNQDAKNFGCIRPSNNEAPLLLLRICRRWRDCALSSCLLWSKLSVGRGKNGLRSVMAAKSWLDRAGQAPLSVDVYYGEPRPDRLYTQNAIHGALKDIFNPSRNWKAVSLEAYETRHNPIIDAILEAVLAHAPVLESFAIRITGFGSSAIQPRRFIEIGFTPRLSSISVHATHISLFRLLFSAAYAYGNVCDLKLRWPESINHGLHILERCPNVEVLRISLREEHPPPARTTTVALERLHTLKITGSVDTPKDFGDFLDGLTTPALTELSIKVGTTMIDSFPRHWPSLLKLLVRSQPPLKSFTLIGTHMTADNIVDCLRNMPELTATSGDRQLFSSAVINALTPWMVPMKVPLCPKLVVIGLKDKSACLPDLTWMIYARWKISKGKCSWDRYKVQIPAVEVVELPQGLDLRFHFLQSPAMTKCLEDGLELRYT
ncbi:hypothetical protein BD410DRAFT_828442 [Rickenella mellea]|uniref:Uncharacterized protein n=1 Tax=Rickenella mellea TaxID=50990 RepID=A0A4Y7Q683_9AGAM|nr:hypothetical protein BD410DRAFT_828442 [Rickenella mellea]